MIVIPGFRLPRSASFFSIRLSLDQLPGLRVALRPVFPENAAADQSLLRHLSQARLHSNADVSSRTRRSITMNQLQQANLLPARDTNLPLQPLQCFLHRRPIRF